MATPHHRSGFEARLRERLDANKISYGYELETFPIQVEVGRVNCPTCGTVTAYKPSRYTPDFFFNNWVIEAKGKFTAKDRKRFLALLHGHGDRRRFGLLFMRLNKLSKSSKTRYSDWCDQHGIPWAVGWFKDEWLA